MGRLTLFVAGGDEAAREALVSELFEALRIMTRTDDAGPRIISTDDDSDGIRLRTSTTH